MQAQNGGNERAGQHAVGKERHDAVHTEYRSRIAVIAVGSVLVASLFLTGTAWAVCTVSFPGGVRTTEGGSGNDTCTGSSATDFMFAYAGNDFFDGSGGQDEVHGNQNNDDLRGSDGDDELWDSHNGPDTDRLCGGQGADDHFMADGDTNDKSWHGNAGDVTSHDIGDQPGLSGSCPF